jgi:predicted aspartyl protease
MKTFPYIYRGNGYYPIIEVTLFHGTNIFRTDALIDSGANISVFQGEIAEILGINITKGEKRIFQGVGAKVTGYIHNIEILVGTDRINCRVAFSNEMSTSLNILGRDNFFKHFLVTFDEHKKNVILQKQSV